MIINDKYLNSKPVYEIPEGVDIKLVKRGSTEYSDLDCDVCINAWGVVGVCEAGSKSIEYRIKVEDVLLLRYLNNYNWLSLFSWYDKGTPYRRSPFLYKYNISKVISDYYKGLEDDNK